MSVFRFFFGCDVYRALALGRKLENIMVYIHMYNDGDVSSVDGTFTKENVIKGYSTN